MMGAAHRDASVRNGAKRIPSSLRMPAEPVSARVTDGAVRQFTHTLDRPDEAVPVTVGISHDPQEAAAPQLSGRFLVSVKISSGVIA